ncbi:MAG: hypothetical protein ABIK89_12050 [Planctomycetota bacterium]
MSIPTPIPLFDPYGSRSFEFLNPIGQGDRPGLTRHKMHVILGAADEDGRTVQGLGGTAELFVHLVAETGIAEKRFAVLGRIDRVDDHVR